jgi:diaminohydroxyphosphoribosylaminopyrimidine deaminase/5-amino-6-(5-phosphoribosylamino)uracil reductase
MKFSAADRKYMRLALSLAKKGAGKTSPNPAVGAVLVKKGKIIAKGYHKKAGLPHAEAVVIKKAKSACEKATLYCTLEACTHYGKTPPCSDAIIKSGIKKAIFAMKDPNPVNCGRGIDELKKAGIKTQWGLLKAEAEKLNRQFIKFMTKKMPYVCIKIAQTLDGKIADDKGKSKWISSETSRKFVHKLRGKNDAVMIGVDTVIKDDPLLTVRLSEKVKKQPLRVVLDSHLRIPLKSRLLNTADKYNKVLIVGKKGAPKNRKIAIEKKGAEVILVSEKNSHIDITDLLQRLAGMDITSLLCEGGSRVATSLIKNNLADELYLFIAPKILGGEKSPSLYCGMPSELKSAKAVRDIKITRLGDDILVRGKF